MYDTLAAAMLADHLNHNRRRRKAEPMADAPAEPESPWARVFAWHRRKVTTQPQPETFRAAEAVTGKADRDGTAAQSAQSLTRSAEDIPAPTG